MEKFFKVMVINDGYPESHTEWLSEQEAIDMRNDLTETFPDFDYYVEQHDASDEQPMDEAYRHTPSDACDGWEDMFPDYE